MRTKDVENAITIQSTAQVFVQFMLEILHSRGGGGSSSSGTSSSSSSSGGSHGSHSSSSSSGSPGNNQSTTSSLGKRTSYSAPESFTLPQDEGPSHHGLSRLRLGLAVRRDPGDWTARGR